PIEKAKHTKSQLLSANPMLVYKISDQGLLMTHVFIHSPSNSLYTAELSKDAGKRKESYQVATIDVADMMGQTTVAMASMAANLGSSVTSVSIDPEIKKLKEKINKAKIDNLEKARKKRYIAKLQKELEKYTATTKKQYFDDLESLIATRKKTLVNPKKYAVVIGIEKYASTAEVAFANRSAKAFSSLAEKILGVPKDNIYTLTDSQATAGNISVRIKDFAARVPRGGTLYFYYAGHGIPAQVKGKTGLPYILPYDISPQFIHLEDRFMLSNIWKQLSYNNRGKVVAFMDSCFSGNADNNLVFEGVAPGLMRRVDATLPNNKILIYTAGNSHQFANYYPEKGHRLFSYYLFKGLMEGRQKTALGLQDYIQTNVSKQSRKMGPAYEQTPEIKGNTKEGIL
ncbi:MAG: caspase family protein, partial [Gammaproteobacteria bacterium]|nr:caspase family protein [Gammaproteobacteria bacterium]